MKNFDTFHCFSSFFALFTPSRGNCYCHFILIRIENDSGFYKLFEKDSGVLEVWNGSEIFSFVAEGFLDLEKAFFTALKSFSNFINLFMACRRFLWALIFRYIFWKVHIFRWTRWEFYILSMIFTFFFSVAIFVLRSSLRLNWSNGRDHSFVKSVHIPRRSGRSGESWRKLIIESHQITTKSWFRI